MPCGRAYPLSFFESSDFGFSGFCCSGTEMLSTVFVVSGVVYCPAIIRHFFGQASAQLPQCIHFILSIAQILSALFTFTALVGHFFTHIPQRIQSVSFILTLPLVLSCHSLGTLGYLCVAGFFNMLFSTNFVIL